MLRAVREQTSDAATQGRMEGRVKGNTNCMMCSGLTSKPATIPGEKKLGRREVTKLKKEEDAGHAIPFQTIAKEG